MKILRSTTISYSLFVIFFLMAVGYYFEFAKDVDLYQDDGQFLQYALNWRDHFRYVAIIDNFGHYDYRILSVDNNFGISALYYYTNYFRSDQTVSDYSALSLYINSIAILGSLVVYIKICDLYDLGLNGKLTFFVNLPFIYFMQLINKDAISVFALLLIVYLGIKQRYVWIFILAVLFVFIRVQFLVFGLGYLALLMCKTRSRAFLIFFLLYTVISLFSGFVARIQVFVSAETIGGGFSGFVADFSRRYYVGYFLFNPIRMLQMFYDFFLSFSIFTENGGIDVARLLRFPQLLTVIYFAPVLISAFSGFFRSVGRGTSSVLFAVPVFLLAWLMNPTINARYFTLIVPVLILAALIEKRRQLDRHRIA